MGKRRRRRQPSPGERKKLSWRARLAERVAGARGEALVPHPEPRRAVSADAVVIHPRLAPESATDMLVYAGAMLAVLVELLLIPAIIYDLLGRGRPAVIAAALVFAAELAVRLASTVSRLTLDSRGIHLARRLGRRFIPWKDVTVVHRAGRGELAYCGWIFPPVPAAEATHSMTAVGHLSIDYKGGVIYYPAMEETEFLAAVRRWAPRVRLLAGEEGNPAPGRGR